MITILTKEGFTYRGERKWFFNWWPHIWGKEGIDFFIVVNQ